MPRITKVLIANRGEIAVRVIRAARDAGIGSVAVYADQDRDARHAKLADEAYALDGTTSAETYLVIDKLLSVARRSGADAVHPGYGFLAENPDFARAVIDAGLIWIGPSPEAIERLGDKVSARHVAEKVGAPLAPGTLNPVADAAEVLEFVDVHGLPVAIKAAFGGGGRGLKVARTREEVPELFESATREAVAAFGRGECFVEKYLDKPRHVETQCLADEHGNVVVVSTRDCSLQRRHQKLVEEAPAPFLTEEQSRRALRRVEGDPQGGRLRRRRHVRVPHRPGRHGLLPRGEHPPAGRAPGLGGGHRDRPRARAVPPRRGRRRSTTPTPSRSGHSIEFRINGEDPGRNFLPSPGPVHAAALPRRSRRPRRLRRHDRRRDLGRVRLAAREAHRHRRHRAKDALERARRALDEFEVAGLPTVLPFHRDIVRNPAFAPEGGAPFSVYTRWIETEYDNQLEPWSGELAETSGPAARTSVVVEVAGRRVEVTLPKRLVGGSSAAARRPGPAPRRRAAGALGRHRHRRCREGADAGDGREGGGRRGRQGRQGRPRARARGHEDGAADRRPQGRRDRPRQRGGRRHRLERAPAPRINDA